MRKSVPTSSNYTCPSCDSDHVQAMSGTYALFKCAECEEHFDFDELVEVESPARHRTKLRDKRYSEEE